MSRPANEGTGNMIDKTNGRAPETREGEKGHLHRKCSSKM
jgi:hypothetical protein